MWLFIPLLIGLVAAVLIAIVFGAEQHANNKRIERGEPPVKHHDITDRPPPVNTIDWTRRK